MLYIYVHLFILFKRIWWQLSLFYFILLYVTHQHGHLIKILKW